MGKLELLFVEGFGQDGAADDAGDGEVVGGGVVREELGADCVG
jgi:hypothetical protein